MIATQSWVGFNSNGTGSFAFVVSDGEGKGYEMPSPREADGGLSLSLEADASDWSFLDSALGDALHGVRIEEPSGDGDDDDDDRWCRFSYSVSGKEWYFQLDDEDFPVDEDGNRLSDEPILN